VKTTYRKIRMNAYAFPEHVVISEAAKDLVSRILIGDPTQRPTLDQVISHDFFNNGVGGSIPKCLPQSFLACPPSGQYIKQFMPNQGTSTAHYGTN
jgi:polo-like kinase 1